MTETIQTDAFAEKIVELQRQLGIPENYALNRNLALCEECTRLVSIGHDIFDREQKMEPRAAGAWLKMKTAAASAGIELQAISAFRSVDYQAGIIRRKLDNGQAMTEILQVSAAPGYSEHHTGRALDVSTPGYEPLEEAFEKSPAFAWLQKTAGQFRFRLSYPRNNPYGVRYEPWHWCWIPADTDSESA